MTLRGDDYLSRLAAGPSASSSSAVSSASHGRVMLCHAQLPGETGSGVYLQQMARHLSHSAEVHVVAAGYDVLGPIELPELEPHRITTCRFTRPGEAPAPDAVSFPIVGMSDTMPYPSTTWGELDSTQTNEYLTRFAAALAVAGRTFGPTAIQVNHAWLLASLVRLQFPTVPVVVSAHGTCGKQLRNHPRFSDYVTQWISSSHGVLAISEESRTQLSEEYGVAAERIHMGGYGFDPRVFTPDRSRDDRSSLNRLGVPEEGRNDPLILAIGKFVDWKGFAELIDAVRATNESIGPVTCVIIGEGSKESRRRLEEKVREAGLAGRCLLPGAQPQRVLAAALRSADVFVLSSYDEPWGLVLMEALACGSPVVFANRGAPREYVSSSLVERGLASPVKPILLDESSEPLGPAERGLYSERLRRGIESILRSRVTDSDRRSIADSVAHLRWERLATQVLNIAYAPGATRGI